MIDVFELYEKHCGNVNTHQGGHVRPHRNFLNWVRDINLELFKEYVQVFEKTQVISDNLTPFLISKNVVIKPNAGTPHDVIVKPADYARYGTMRVYRRGTTPVALPGIDTCSCTGEKTECPDALDADEKAALDGAAAAGLKEVPVEKIDNIRWGALATRKTKGATVNAPKCTQFDGGFKIMPKSLGVVVFDFFRFPKQPTFEYTILDQGTETERIQYDQTRSQPLEWSADLVDEFLARLSIRYGQFTRNQVVQASGEREKEETK